MLTALGYSFLDANGRQLDGSGRTWRQIHSIHRTVLPELADTELIVASDVHNPLLGAHGRPCRLRTAKGRRSTEIAALDDGLEHLVAKLAEAGFPEAAALAGHEGAGSAGGIGYACLLLGARQVSGADYFLDLLDFNARKDSCDVVITGEGSIDEQTLSGKLPAAVARRRAPPDHRRRRTVPAPPGALVRDVVEPGLHAGRIHGPGLVQGPRTFRRPAPPDRTDIGT